MHATETELALRRWHCQDPVFWQTHHRRARVVQRLGINYQIKKCSPEFAAFVVAIRVILRRAQQLTRAARQQRKDMKPYLFAVATMCLLLVGCERSPNNDTGGAPGNESTSTTNGGASYSPGVEATNSDAAAQEPGTNQTQEGNSSTNLQNNTNTPPEPH